MNVEAAKAYRNIGVSGFEGFVWHSFTLGSVAIQADTNCTPHTAYIIEPSSFFYITPPGGEGIQWLSHGQGSRIWPIHGDTLGTPTFSRQAMAYCLIGLQNDQPQANAIIKHICTARESEAA
jgi:hypothetical protein